MLDLFKFKSDVNDMIVYEKGKIIWDYRERSEFLYEQFSITKSFVATLLGIAIDEGYINIDEKLSFYFKDNLCDANRTFFENISLKDVLTMSMGYKKGMLFAHERKTLNNYLDYCLKLPLSKNKTFIYSNVNAYIIGVIIEKATGCKLIDYMDKKLFAPLDIKNYEYETSPEGYFFGASGLKISTYDLLKLGVLYLNKGIHNDNRIISSGFIEDATSNKIDANKKGCGYGYFWWINENGCYMASGKYGQICFVNPKKSIVVSVNSNLHKSDVLIDYLLDKFK